MENKEIMSTFIRTSSGRLYNLDYIAACYQDKSSFFVVLENNSTEAIDASTYASIDTFVPGLDKKWYNPSHIVMFESTNGSCSMTVSGQSQPIPISRDTFNRQPLIDDPPKLSDRH